MILNFENNLISVKFTDRTPNTIAKVVHEIRGRVPESFNDLAKSLNDLKRRNYLKQHKNLT